MPFNQLSASPFFSLVCFLNMSFSPHVLSICFIICWWLNLLQQDQGRRAFLEGRTFPRPAPPLRPRSAAGPWDGASDHGWSWWRDPTHPTPPASQGPCSRSIELDEWMDIQTVGMIKGVITGKPSRMKAPWPVIMGKRDELREAAKKKKN